MSRENLDWKISVLFSILFLIFLINPAQALVEIEPNFYALSMHSDTEFTVNITISGVNNVYGFQFDVDYDDNILQYVNISEMTFLNRSGQDRTYCLQPELSISGKVDNFACSRFGDENVSGSGFLANVTFSLEPQTSFPATSSITLSGVKISDLHSQGLDNTTQDGQITVYECLNGETRSCPVGICQGTKTCNSSNQWGDCAVTGTNPEICDGLDNDCDGYVDNDPGTTQNHTLSRDCSLNYNGTCAAGTETCQEISTGVFDYVGCPQPQEEACESGQDENCNGQDDQCRGDVVDDGCVDIQDLALVGANFGLTSDHIDFDPRADINNDGEVDIFDLVTIGREYGMGAACP